MSKIEIKKTELVWKGKYDDEGKLIPVEKPGPYPFQIIEVVNQPRSGNEELKPQQNLFDTYKGDEGDTFETGWLNKLIWGDNKFVMSSLLEKFAGKIDLIYIDPPFATGADFRMNIEIGEKGEEVYKEHSIIEEKAYRDTWGNGLNSFLTMVFDRLALMKELLSSNGSIIVHIDGRVNSYVRLIMDELYGANSLRNQIIWCYGGGGAPKNYYPQKSDTLLWYSKSDNWTFNKQFRPYTEGTLERGLTEVKGPKYELNEEGAGLDDWWQGKEVQKILSPTAYENIKYPTQKPEGLLKRIIFGHSNEYDLVADFFCGSGTTCAVAEKLNRRWIGVDLGRYAIHTTRKRLLEIANSKDLNDNSKKYGKPARPFEILNLGKYERQFWQVKAFNRKDEKQALYEYLAFILKLYGAEPIAGSSHIHGKKGNALIYVGAVDSPVTIQEVNDAMRDCKEMEQKELHVLGWEWEMGLNDAIEKIAKQEGIKLKPRCIPMDILDPEAVRKGDIRFFELAYFKVELETNKKEVKIKLDDFVIPHTDLIPQEIKDSIKKWKDWIDYWAVDFDFKNDTFNNTWTSYRTRQDRRLNFTVKHTYEKPGNYNILIKIIDIFGIDTSQLYEVKIPVLTKSEK